MTINSVLILQVGHQPYAMWSVKPLNITRCCVSPEDALPGLSHSRVQPLLALYFSFVSITTRLKWPRVRWLPRTPEKMSLHSSPIRSRNHPAALNSRHVRNTPFHWQSYTPTPQDDHETFLPFSIHFSFQHPASFISLSHLPTGCCYGELYRLFQMFLVNFTPVLLYLTFGGFNLAENSLVNIFSGAADLWLLTLTQLSS